MEGYEDAETRFPRETAQRKLREYDTTNEVARIWRLTLGVALGFLALVSACIFAIVHAIHTRGLFVALLSLSLVAGCHTVSDTAMQEMETAASSAEGSLKDWPRLTDDQKKETVWKLGRAERSGLASARGDTMPDFYASDPWAQVAPVGSR